jgi:hypothetical protein
MRRRTLAFAGAAWALRAILPPGGPIEIAIFTRHQIAMWSEVVRAVGMKLEN